MAENFLEEQLKRIREMSEQMSRVRNYTAELSEELRRDRERLRWNPLHEVRDFRWYSSTDQPRATSDDRSGTAEDQPGIRRSRSGAVRTRRR